MPNWKEYKLGDLIESISETFKFGEKEVCFLNTSDTLEGKVINHQMFKPKDLPGQAKKRIQKDDILYSEIRPANRRYAYIDFDGSNYVVSTKLMVFRIKEHKLISSKYLYYFLTSEEIVSYLQMLAESRSGTFPQIRFEEIKSLDILLPSIKIQNSIVELISSLDDKIELNNQINYELEALAQALFKQWFIDFEFPNENGQPYKSSGGEMVESDLGEIPKGWKISSLDKIAEYLNGLALQKFPPESESEYLTVIKIKELKNGISESSDKASINVPGSGSLMIDFWTNGMGALNQHLFKVSSETFPKWYYFWWTKYHLSEFIEIAESKATTMGHIQRHHLADAKVLIPLSSQLSDFSKTLDPITEQIIENRIENNSLTELRDELLPKLISGELEISEVQLSELGLVGFKDEKILSSGNRKNK
jgi:type I restriction enzyme S subunit